MMFDMVVSTVYGAVTSAVSTLLADALVDVYNMIDKIVYVGGKRDDCICLSSEEINDFGFGCAFQAATEEYLRLCSLSS